jgi:hypothetical protein
VLVVLGYAAFILAGYNPFGLPWKETKRWRSAVLCFALALLTFEVAIAQPGTMGLQIYLTLTSAFTLGFVANTVYFGASNDLAHNPTTYLGRANVATQPLQEATRASRRRSPGWRCWAFCSGACSRSSRNSWVSVFRFPAWKASAS